MACFFQDGNAQAMNFKGYTKFELVMGLAVISIAVLLTLPPLQGGVDKDQPTRAEEKAKSLAWAVQDFHSDTGKWPKSGPMSGTAMAELTSRTGPMPHMGAMGTLNSDENANRPYLQEIPLDPWERPYSVWILDQSASVDTGTVVVISAGPDGVMQTDPDQWSGPTRALAGGRISEGSSKVPEDLFEGDDVGFILANTAPGSAR